MNGKLRIARASFITTFIIVFIIFVLPYFQVRRLGFDLGGAWRISMANVDYQLCPTYPKKLVVPASINDNVLDFVARFRAARRIPAVVWR